MATHDNDDDDEESEPEPDTGTDPFDRLTVGSDLGEAAGGPLGWLAGSVVGLALGWVRRRPRGGRSDEAG